MQYFLTNQVELWYILGAVLMIIEMYLGGTIGFFFAGIAAFCVALCMKFNLITLVHMFEHLYNPLEGLKIPPRLKEESQLKDLQGFA